MIGQTISHYKILEKLGEGGMGVVYKAKDTKLDRTVALKFLTPQAVGNEEEKTRFIHEAKAAAALNHPNICTVYEIDESEGQSFIAMEYVAGQSLKARIESGTLNLEETIDVACQIAKGLSEAHDKGIVHRDIKPANIMLTAKGEAKIMDFGLARSAEHTALTRTGTTVGTVAYMSPEQARGEEVDQQTDLWSFGVVLYELATRRRPFKGNHEQAIIYSILNEEPELTTSSQTSVPKELEGIIAKSLAKGKDERYQNADEMLIDLKAFKDKNKSKKEEEQTSTKSPRKSRRRTKPFVAVIALLAVLIVIIGYIVFDPFKEAVPPWLEPDATLERLTSKSGVEHGKISPDGRYLAYVDNGGVLTLKMLTTGEVKNLGTSEHTYHKQPAWSPDGTHIATIAIDGGEWRLLIYSALGRLTRQFEVPKRSFSPAWSPDGSWIAFGHAKLDSASTLAIIRPDGTDMTEYPVNAGVACPAWSPDSRCIAFVESERSQSNFIRILDVESGAVSDALKGAKPCAGFWYEGGLAWSPDGRYLVYVGYDEDFRELFALRLNKRWNAASGPPIVLTRFRGVGEPHWPCFSGDGNRLSFGIEENNTDIYAAPIDVEGAAILGKVIPVATDQRRDWDPCWMPDGQSVVFSSMRDGQPDLYRYYIETTETERLTMTQTMERNAQVSPAGDEVRYWSQGALWRIPSEGGTARQITPDSIRVHHSYAWPPGSTSLFVTIPDTSRERAVCFARIDLSSGHQSVCSEVLNDWTMDVSLSPDGNLLAVSGIRVHPANAAPEKVSILDIGSGQWRDIVEQAAIIPRGRISWTPDSRFILHDLYDPQKNRIVYELLPVADGTPIEVDLDVGIIEGEVLLDRIDPSGKRVLLKVIVDESDMWLLGGKGDD